MSRRIVPVLLVVVGGCFGFDDLEARALSALDGGAADAGAAGGASGGVSGGMAGGASGGMSGGVSGGMAGGASGGMAGGASGGIAGGAAGGIAGGAADASIGDGGVPDGGPPSCVAGDGGFPFSCPCVCQDGGCTGTCAFRQLRRGTGPSSFGSTLPLALTASGNRVFVVTTIDAGRLLELDQNLQSLDASVIPGTLRVLDARRGVGVAITSSGVYSTNGVSQTLPSGIVSSCQGGGVYELGGSIRLVAACQIIDGGFEASDVPFSGGVQLPMPPNATDQSLVWIRPDRGGTVGRYLISLDGGSPWAYRTFEASVISGTESELSANQAVLATTEDQTAMLVFQELAGVVRYRPLGNLLGQSTRTQLTSSQVDLRGVFTFDAGLASPVDVYVLQSAQTPSVPTFRGFELSGPPNGWFVVVDRPSGVILYSLGVVDGARAAIVQSRGLLVVSRCSSMSGSSVCSAGPGTYVEWLPID
jgi:hypothetical protein